MNAKKMIDMGYIKDGDLWISPTSGEVMSYEQARQEAEKEQRVNAIVETISGEPTNGSHW